MMVSSIAVYGAANTIASTHIVYDNTNSNLRADNVQDAIDELYGAATDYASLKAEMLGAMYPVGSIYITTTLTSTSQVASKLGGTWEVYGAGRTLVGVGTGTDSNSTSKSFPVNSTGGEYNHTLTVSEMPSHNHNTYMYYNQTGYWTDIPSGSMYVTYFEQNAIGFTTSTLTNRNKWKNGYVDNTGGSQSHNNLQPYIAVYMYKRTS